MSGISADGKKPDETMAETRHSSGSESANLASEYGVDEKKLLRKLDWRLLPGCGILYLLSFLDRSNVANARVEGLTTDLGMTGNQYLTGLTLFFLGYILFEIPANLILRYTSPKIWLPSLTLVWGVVTTLQGVTQNLAGFFVVRTVLGICEGGLFPGVVFYFSMWYRRSERSYRVAVFFGAAALAGAFGGILAFGIAHMKGVGGLDGWRWIFIIEGILTCVIATAAYWFIANYPENTSWLSKNEQEFLHQRIIADSDATSNEGITVSNVLRALKDIKVWLYCFAYHTMSLPLYTLSLFLPTIIKGLGYTSGEAQLLTVPPYALAAALTVIVAILAERTKKRAIFIMTFSLVAIIGYAILLGNTATKTTISILKGKEVKTVNYLHPGISYLGTFFCAAGIYPATALVLSLPAINVSGATKRATAGGLQISIGNLGAVIGTQIYRTQNSPQYVVGHSVALAYLFLNICVMGTLWIVLKRENTRKEAQGVPEKVAGEEWQGDDDVRWRFIT